MKKPLIGITTSESLICFQNNFRRYMTMVNQAYINLVTSFNATPILLSCRSPLDQVNRLVNLLDGLIFIGGQDIHPQFWGEAQKVTYSEEIKGMGKPFFRPNDYSPLKERDEFEIALYQAAKKKQIPILGICRGLQIINIAEGGTLHQELPESTNINHTYGDDGWIHHHLINIDPNSQVYSFMQIDKYFISSLHHQGINNLGKNLKTSAWADDGIIEIIENIDNNNFILGIHGHIEQTRQNLKLYEKILEAFFFRANNKNLTAL